MAGRERGGNEGKRGGEVAAGKQTDEQEDRQVGDDPEVQKIQVSHTKHEENKSLYTKYATIYGRNNNL